METNQETQPKQKRVYDHEESRELGRRLKSLRVLKGLSQIEVADRAGLSAHTIISIEAGRYNTGVRQLTAILDAMGYELVFQPKALSPDHHTA